jgi:hypothetical protein
MNARKGYVFASLGLVFLVASLLLGTPLRGPSEAAIDAAARGIKVLITNPPEAPVLVSQVSDPANLQVPFAKWITVDLSKGDQIVKSHFFDVPADKELVLTYANVDLCAPTEIKQVTINLMAAYPPGPTAPQHIKLITQPQGIFPDDDDPGSLYSHFGVSQPMTIRLAPGTSVDAWIYRSLQREGHSEANLWVSGFLLPPGPTR